MIPMKVVIDWGVDSPVVLSSTAVSHCRLLRMNRAEQGEMKSHRRTDFPGYSRVKESKTGSLGKLLVGSLEHDWIIFLCFSIYWEFYHPN